MSQNFDEGTSLYFMTKKRETFVLFFLYKLRCCEFKGKQASKIESTSLCCISYTVLLFYMLEIKRMSGQSL